MNPSDVPPFNSLCSHVLKIFADVCEVFKQHIDGDHFSFPEVVKPTKEELEKYQKQDCDMELFPYEYVNQSGGVTGDDFSGTILYPIDEERFIKIEFYS